MATESPPSLEWRAYEGLYGTFWTCVIGPMHRGTVSHCRGGYYVAAAFNGLPDCLSSGDLGIFATREGAQRAVEAALGAMARNGSATIAEVGHD